MQSLAHWLFSPFQWRKHYFVSVLCYIYVISVVDIIQGAILICPWEVWETCGRGRVFYMCVWFQSFLTLWQHAFQSHTWREFGFLCVLSLSCIDASGTSGSFLFLWSYVCFGSVFICTMRAITSVYKHDSASLSSRKAAAVALPDLAGFGIRVCWYLLVEPM